MSQTTKHRPMKDKGEQVVSFFKEWLFGFFFFYPPRDRKGKKTQKKSFIALLYITFHLSTDTK